MSDAEREKIYGTGKNTVWGAEAVSGKPEAGIKRYVVINGRGGPVTVTDSGKQD